jgi:hypothetical protein
MICTVYDSHYSISPRAWNEEEASSLKSPNYSPWSKNLCLCNKVFCTAPPPPLARESLISDIPAGDGKIANLFNSVSNRACRYLLKICINELVPG